MHHTCRIAAPAAKVAALSPNSHAIFLSGFSVLLQYRGHRDRQVKEAPLPLQQHYDSGAESDEDDASSGGSDMQVRSFWTCSHSVLQTCVAQSH